MRTLCLALLLSLGAIAHADSDPNHGCSVSVTAGPLMVKQCDFSFAKQGDHVMLLWDVTPYKDELKGKEGNALLQAARGLVQGPAMAKYPKIKHFKVTVAEVPERDNYGLPQWSSLKVTDKFIFVVKKDGLHQIAPK